MKHALAKGRTESSEEETSGAHLVKAPGVGSFFSHFSETVPRDR